MDRARQRSANLWLVLVFEVVFVAAAETLLKVGASKTARVAGWEWTGLLALGSIWTWWAIALIVLSFLCWIYVLKYIPLSIAFPLSNLVHVLIPLNCWIFLGHHISPQLCCRIAFLILYPSFRPNPTA